MKKILGFLSLLILASCTSDRHPETELDLPADSIIPEPQMILMLADAHTIEAAMLVDRNKGLDTKGQADFYYSGLFRKYRVSRERYQKNIEYYRSDQEHFIQMYEKVNRELTKRENDFIKEIPR